MGIIFEEFHQVYAGEPVICKFRITGILKVHPNMWKKFSIGIGPLNMLGVDDIFMLSDVPEPSENGDEWMKIVFPAECIPTGLLRMDAKLAFCAMHQSGCILQRSHQFHIDYTSQDDEMCGR